MSLISSAHLQVVNTLPSAPRAICVPQKTQREWRASSRNLLAAETKKLHSCIITRRSISKLPSGCFRISTSSTSFEKQCQSAHVSERHWVIHTAAILGLFQHCCRFFNKRLHTLSSKDKHDCSLSISPCPCRFRKHQFRNHNVKRRLYARTYDVLRT